MKPWRVVPARKIIMREEKFFPAARAGFPGAKIHFARRKSARIVCAYG
jgi:hypothetical protein